MIEEIVLVDEAGSPIGVAEKFSSHHANTPLHLAFSCYVFNDLGEFLVTQRALSKKVWPGVWTNSVCGHPQAMHRTGLPGSGAASAAGALGARPDFYLRSSPHRTGSTAQPDAQEEISPDTQVHDLWEVEPMEEAIKRRLDYELGMTADDVQVVLPKYRYQTPPYNDIIENEFCPVFVARATREPRPNPDEVEAWKWVPWQEFVHAASADDKDAYSWWCKDQLKQLVQNPTIHKFAQSTS